jgi:hypothetical protein
LNYNKLLWTLWRSPQLNDRWRRPLEEARLRGYPHTT